VIRDDSDNAYAHNLIKALQNRDLDQTHAGVIYRDGMGFYPSELFVCFILYMSM
jgi:hypothetical protein